MRHGHCLLDVSEHSLAFGELFRIAIEEDDVIAKRGGFFRDLSVMFRSRFAGRHQDDTSLALRWRKLLLRVSRDRCSDDKSKRSKPGGSKRDGHAIPSRAAGAGERSGSVAAGAGERSGSVAAGAGERSGSVAAGAGEVLKTGTGATIGASIFCCQYETAIPRCQKRGISRKNRIAWLSTNAPRTLSALRKRFQIQMPPIRMMAATMVTAT